MTLTITYKGHNCSFSEFADAWSSPGIDARFPTLTALKAEIDKQEAAERALHGAPALWLADSYNSTFASVTMSSFREKKGWRDRPEVYCRTTSNSGRRESPLSELFPITDENIARIAEIDAKRAQINKINNEIDTLRAAMTPFTKETLEEAAKAAEQAKQKPRKNKAG